MNDPGLLLQNVDIKKNCVWNSRISWYSHTYLKCWWETAAIKKKTGPQRTWFPWESLGHSNRLKKGKKNTQQNKTPKGMQNLVVGGGSTMMNLGFVTISTGTAFCYVNCFSPPPRPRLPISLLWWVLTVQLQFRFQGVLWLNWHHYTMIQYQTGIYVSLVLEIKDAYWKP